MEADLRGRRELLEEICLGSSAYLVDGRLDFRQLQEGLRVFEGEIADSDAPVHTFNKRRRAEYP